MSVKRGSDRTMITCIKRCIPFVTNVEEGGGGDVRYGRALYELEIR